MTSKYLLYLFKDYWLLQSDSLFLRSSTFLLFRQWSNFTEITAQTVQLLVCLRDNVGLRRPKRKFFSVPSEVYYKFIEM